MKIIKETEIQFRAKRSYDKSHNMCIGYITESATNNYVSIRVMGYACLSIENWKVSKKQAKSNFEALYLIADEAYRRGNL